MINISDRELPPGDRAQTPDFAEVTEPKPPGEGWRNDSKPYDRELLAHLKQFRDTQRLSQSDIARQIGVSSSAVSKYLTGKPEGDVAKLEGLLRFLMENQAERINLKREVKETALSRRVCSVLSSIANTSDFGVLSGRAGIGKTCGAELLLTKQKFTTAILLTAGQSHGGASHMIGDLWQASRARGTEEETGMDHFKILCRRFRGSDRFVIIDDAHLLTASGLMLWRTFHNLTGCPVALIGNPTIIDKIRKLPDEDQFTSRVGQSREIIVNENDAAEIAAILLDQYLPEKKASLMPAATQVACKRGFARRLKKQIRLTDEILVGGFNERSSAIKDMRAAAMDDASIAFALAATQLLTLPEAA